jgi:hypothetical protein
MTLLYRPLDSNVMILDIYSPFKINIVVSNKGLDIRLGINVSPNIIVPHSYVKEVN